MAKEIKDLTDKERAALFPVILSEYNSEWADWYEDEKARLVNLIGTKNIARIRHYGSTSVPNLLAKPTVDILLEVKNGVSIEKILAALPYPEYNVMCNTAVLDKIDIVAVKGYMVNGFADRVFHIHLREYGEHPEITFRDYLIKHPETAAEYAGLKRQLQKEYEYDRDGYTSAKGEFISSVLEKASSGFDNDLLRNINKLHTTPMGAERIKRNLGLDDVIFWCKEIIFAADSITRQGKNWYAYKNDVVITINSHSYTIITAHKIKTKMPLLTLRPFCNEDIALMERWLYLPHVAKWYKHPDHWLRELRERHGEFSFLTHFIAEYNGKPIGFCQYYDCFFAKEHEVWNEEWHIGEKQGETYSIDYLIGETEFLRRGYGKQMINQMLEKIWKLGAEKIIVGPEKENIASNKVLESVGFIRCGDDYILKRSML